MNWIRALLRRVVTFRSESCPVCSCGCGKPRLYIEFGADGQVITRRRWRRGDPE